VTASEPPTAPFCPTFAIDPAPYTNPGDTYRDLRATMLNRLPSGDLLLGGTLPGQVTDLALAFSNSVPNLGLLADRITVFSAWDDPQVFEEGKLAIDTGLTVHDLSRPFPLPFGQLLGHFNGNPNEFAELMDGSCTPLGLVVIWPYRGLKREVMQAIYTAVCQAVFPEGQRLPEGLAAHTAFLLHDGRLLVAEGWRSSGEQQEHMVGRVLPALAAQFSDRGLGQLPTPITILGGLLSLGIAGDGGYRHLAAPTSA